MSSETGSGRATHLQMEDLQGQLRLLQAVGFGSVEDGQSSEIEGPGDLLCQPTA